MLYEEYMSELWFKKILDEKVNPYTSAMIYNLSDMFRYKSYNEESLINLIFQLVQSNEELIKQNTHYALNSNVIVYAENINNKDKL